MTEDQPPPRQRTTMRDLIGAMIVLLILVGAVIGVTRSCSFSPGGPTVAPPTRSVDVTRGLAEAARSVDFPVRRPDPPAGWRANSSSTAPVGRGASVVVRVGWLTPVRYVQLSQSGGAVAEVMATETDREDAVSTGTVDVNQVRWTVYPGRRNEQAWATRLDRTTVVITGTGTEDEFRALALAVQAATPLPGR